ncbi:hypothetical protein PG984_008152 [Apiospora sp. TS-2023a]
MAKEPKSQGLKVVEVTNEGNRVTRGPWAGRLRANPTLSEFALAEGKKTPADFFMFQKPKKKRVSAGTNPQTKENSSASGVVSRASRKQQKRKERKQRTDLGQVDTEDHASSPKRKLGKAGRREQRHLMKQRRRQQRRLRSSRRKDRRRQRAHDMAPELLKQGLQKIDKAEAAKKQQCARSELPDHHSVSAHSG